MYEENENKIEWKPILKKVGIAVAVIFIIFLIVTGVSKCTKKNDVQPDTPTNINLEKQLDELERATLEYLSVDNLPVELNASKTIRLKIMINKGILTEITDSENNMCDTNESYAEVIRFENNYAVNMSLTCGKNKDSRVIYIGCFENCNGGICKGDASQTGGICEVVTTTPDDNNSQTDNQDTPSSTTQTPSDTKPSTNTSNSNTNTNTNNNTNNNTSNNVTTNRGTLYEYKKCSTNNYCEQGTANANGDCEIYSRVTVYGQVIKIGDKTSQTSATKTSTPVTTTKTVYLRNSQEAKNTATETFKFVGITRQGLYQYEKTTTTYKTVYMCNGKETTSSTCTVSTPIYGCTDDSYTYNASTGQCTKVQGQSTIVGKASSTCETTWSYSSSLPGWTKTGLTR